MPSAKRIAGSTEDMDSPSSKKSRHDGRRESKDSKRDKEKEEPKRNERNETKEKERVRESDRRKSKDDDRENKRDEKRDKESKKEMKESTPKKEHRKESKDSKDSNDSRGEHREKKEREKRDTKNDDVKSEMIGPPLPEPLKKTAHESEKDHKKSTSTRSSRDESEAKSDLRKRISDPVSASKPRSPADQSKTSVSSDPKSSEKKSEKVDDAKKVEKSDAKKSSTSDSSSSKKITSETKSSLTETTKAKPEPEVKKNISEPASTSESKKESETPKSVDSKKGSEASKPVDLKKESVQVAKTTSNSKKTVDQLKGSELKKETTQSSLSSKATPDPKKPTLSSNATNLIKKQIEGPRLNKASETKRVVIEGPKVNAAQEVKKTAVEPVVASRRVIPSVRKPIVEPPKKPIIETKCKTAEEFYAADDEAAKRIGSEALLATFLKDSTRLKEMIKASVDNNDEQMPIALLPVFAHLRRTMRLMGFHNRQIKEGVAATLKTVEHKFLGFQNAKSEIQHLQKDIARCLEFRSADEDIDLDPIEDFYKDAPESISKPEITKENEHELHLARLNWEMQQRSELTETLAELEGRRDALLSAIKGKEKRLQSMVPRLEDVSKTFAPIREVCGNWPGVSKTDESSSPTPKIEDDMPEEAMEP